MNNKCIIGLTITCSNVNHHVWRHIASQESIRDALTHCGLSPQWVNASWMEWSWLAKIALKRISSQTRVTPTFRLWSWAAQTQDYDNWWDLGDQQPTWHQQICPEKIKDIPSICFTNKCISSNGRRLPKSQSHYSDAPAVLCEGNPLMTGRIPISKGQQCRKNSHAMTTSCFKWVWQNGAFNNIAVTCTTTIVCNTDILHYTN